MSEVQEALMLLATAMSQVTGPPGEPYRNLLAKAVFAEKAEKHKKHEKAETEHTCGQRQTCFQNAVQCVHEMSCGYAMTESGVPIAHCWNRDGSHVVETTPAFADKHVFYWGMPIDKEVARDVYMYARHGNEFLDCWKSAVQNAPEGVVDTWRSKLGWQIR